MTETFADKDALYGHFCYFLYKINIDCEKVFRILKCFSKLLYFPDELCLVGVKSKRVRNIDMTASTTYGQFYTAYNGRLDGESYWSPHPYKRK